MRATTAALATLLLLTGTPAAEKAAAAEAATGGPSLCEGLFVPEGYALTCETTIEGGARTEQATVRPSGGVSAASLAQLTLSPLDRAAAPLAWSDPDRWLDDQVAFDVEGIVAAVRGLGLPTGGGQDSAAGQHPAAQAVIDGLAATLAGWARLPLQSCTRAEPGTPARRELSCRFGVAPLALSLNKRLVEAGERRFDLSYWAADEQRMRHLEAIANSFAPAGG